jgi:hypothetical protein
MTRNQGLTKVSEADAIPGRQEELTINIPGL